MKLSTLNISTLVIPHSQQRYPTVGDWWEKDGTLHIRVSRMSDWRYEILVAIHEIVEYVLCRRAGVAEAEVNAFDIAFEKARRPGNTDEPGDDPAAPYRRMHKIATMAERIVAKALGVNWRRYETEVNSL